MSGWTSTPCVRPECQTTAGCKCHSDPRDAEIERLKRERSGFEHQCGVNLQHYDAERSMRQREQRWREEAQEELRRAKEAFALAAKTLTEKAHAWEQSYNTAERYLREADAEHAALSAKLAEALEALKAARPFVLAQHHVAARNGPTERVGTICQACNASWKLGEPARSREREALMPRKPSAEAIAMACEWLEINDGTEGEAEDCKAVAAWLRKLQDEADLKRVARIAEVPVSVARARLKEARNRPAPLALSRREEG
jgi:hypothetical protein